MIFLTGDLHHQSLQTGNQRHCDLPEITVAQRYLSILREAKLPVTFFVSGRAFEQEWTRLQPIVDDALVEIGGHTHRCFEPAWLHRSWQLVSGHYNGPSALESWDVARTIRTARRYSGRRIRLWRNHMYKHGPNTDAILSRHGIVACSDIVDPHATGPKVGEGGLIHVPINVIPDHEHLFHAERTREWVAWFQRRYRWRDGFGSDSYSIEEWTELVLSQVAENEASGATSTILIHPITLYLCDRFRQLHRIIDLLSRYDVRHMGSVVSRLASVTPCQGSAA